MYLKSLLVNKSLRTPVRALELAEQKEVLKKKDVAKTLLPATDDSEGIPMQELSLVLQIYLGRGKGKVVGSGALCVYFTGSKNRFIEQGGLMHWFLGRVRKLRKPSA